MTAFEKLPLEISLDIMSRLPVESVIRCKCVCRSWRSLLNLNNHHFARLHLQRQKKEIISRGNQYDYLMKYNSAATGQDFQFLDYIDHKNGMDEDDDEYNSTLCGNYRLRKIYHPLIVNSHYHDLGKSKWSDSVIRVEGSYDGLVCLSCYGDPTYICNPVTGEYVNLPKHDRFHIRDSTTTSYIVSGFGRYHPHQHGNTDVVYKVVRIFFGEMRKGCEGQVEVYTIGKDHGTWRNIGHISYPLDNSQRGILVNGTIYWRTVRHYMPLLGIVAFDLALEKFYEVTAKVPQEWYSYERISRFRELGGCLYVIKVEDMFSTDVWVLKNNSTTTKDNEEYSSSWVKEFSVPDDWSFCDPFTLTKSGEVLAWCGHHNKRHVFLAHYNPRAGVSKLYVEGSYVQRVNHDTWYGAAAHVKSFICMNDLGEEGVGGVERRREKVEMSLKRKASCLKKILIV